MQVQRSSSWAAQVVPAMDCMRTVHELQKRTSSLRADCQAGFWALAAGCLLRPDCADPNMVFLHVHVSIGGNLFTLSGGARPGPEQPASTQKRYIPA